MLAKLESVIPAEKKKNLIGVLGFGQANLLTGSVDIRASI
jgi:hypothetical protein